MAEEEKIGFEIAMGSISLKQETVEICEYYRLNPYQLTSAGSYLILTDEADQVIEVHSAGNGNKTVYLSADGGKAFLLREGDRMVVRRAKYETELIKLKDRSFYETLCRKMANREMSK